VKLILLAVVVVASVAFAACGTLPYCCFCCCDKLGRPQHLRSMVPALSATALLYFGCFAQLYFTTRRRWAVFSGRRGDGVLRLRAIVWVY
jgi:hypothetical protein